MPSAYPAPSIPSRLFTEEELEAYHRDGVVCARGLLDAKTIDHLREALERIGISKAHSTPWAMSGTGKRGDTGAPL